MIVYFAGIRALGDSFYMETGECFESGFHNWMKRAKQLGKKLDKRVFVDFRQRAHTFEIKNDGTPHLMTNNTTPIIDPALEAQFESG